MLSFDPLRERLSRELRLLPEERELRLLRLEPEDFDLLLLRLLPLRPRLLRLLRFEDLFEDELRLEDRLLPNTLLAFAPYSCFRHVRMFALVRLNRLVLLSSLSYPSSRS